VLYTLSEFFWPLTQVGLIAWLARVRMPERAA
jgi:hypothetical protein